MEADGRLIQNVQHAHQTGADLRGQPDALGLPAGQRGSVPGQGQIVQPHICQKLEAVLHLPEDLIGNLRFLFRELHVIEKVEELRHRHIRHLRDVPAAHAEGQTFRPGRARGRPDRASPPDIPPAPLSFYR